MPEDLNSNKAQGDISDIGRKYEKAIESYTASKGAQKMWNYFLDVIKKDYFIKVVDELKTKYNIPKSGFEAANESYHFPPNNFKQERELRREIIERICKKYELHYFDYSEVILSYIYYNILRPVYEFGSCGLFLVSDVVAEIDDPFGELVQQSDNASYPIAIRISPYASQRDLIDFIKNKGIWQNQIEPLQKRYRQSNIKIGKIKTRKRKIQERNDFIYDQRQKPLKEIRSILAKQKIFLDDGHISKIISLERNRRKEV
jgi:hypothetical protein